MTRKNMALVHTFLLLLFVCICAADPVGNFCDKDSSISSSKISANIDTLLVGLVYVTSKDGYFATSYGEDQDEVYGLAQCRGDVNSTDCSSCIQDAAKQIRQRCPNEADARIWYNYCFLRYSTHNFTGKVDTGYGIFISNIENVTDPGSFNKELGALMDKIRSQAVLPNNEGLGKGKTKLSPFLTLYALGQCTRDLAQIDCAQCLAIAVGNFAQYCNSKKGCRIIYSSCYVRYELYPFFFPLHSNNTCPENSIVAIVYP